MSNTTSRKLKERGDYVDYARGEVYHSELGVITFGEDLQERGMRIFYLFPEEFPEIYAMKDEVKRLPEIGIRRVLQLIN